MNSIATQNRTDFSYSSQVINALRNILPVVVLCVLWVSFQPFQGAQTEIAGSSLLNQVGYTSLSAICVALLFTSVDRRVLISMFSLPWIVLMAALIMSAQKAPVPSDAMRAIAFSIIATVLAASFLAMPPTAEALSKTLRIGCLAVLGLCFAGVILLPFDAIHQASDTESQHAGFWRGLYSHKNVAGPIMATICFAGIYLFRRGMRLSGILIGILALIFISQTGSKTSLAVTPIVALMVLFPALMGMRGLAVLAVLSTAIVTHALTIGTVYSPFLETVLRTFDSSTTFTGRIDIWEFAKPFLIDKIWTGYGYDGFWLTEVTAGAEQPFDRNWDPRGIVHGHNGFLDIALVMGLPMMLVLVWAVFISPVANYLRVPSLRENVFFADFLFMIIAFSVINSALESFFFRRADPVWLTLVFAIFGLRYVSRFPIRGS